MKWTVFLLLLTLFFFSSAFGASESNKAQHTWNQWVKKTAPVWSYGEGNYSLLGFNPAIDAFLKDPFFIPRFANDVSQITKDSLARAMRQAWQFSAYDQGDQTHCKNRGGPPEEWRKALGEAAEPAYASWRCFLEIRRGVEKALSDLSFEEKEFIIDHYRQFFFSKDEPTKYEFFTTESLNPFIFYTYSRQVDLAALARLENRLAAVAEYLAAHRRAFQKLPSQLHFTWEEEGAKLLISGTGRDYHSEDVDMLIDAGGNDTYANNAGGTVRKFPAALLVDFSGNDIYQSQAVASQGAGFLGIGLLADLEGNDTYIGEEISQGAAFFGSGALWDKAGDDMYKLRWFGQGAAAFGTALLYDQSGNDYYAADGMAQAAASTSGASWLIDNRGNDAYQLGDPERKGWIEGMGIGQGGAVGVRFYPWLNTPSLYGGLAVLLDRQGNDTYKGTWFSQGAGYFLSAGFLIDQQGSDVYTATVDSQGQGLHLSAGLLLDEEGNDDYVAEWGSQGTGGDLSAGILIDEKGNDTYLSGEHNLATSRKPFALGLLFEGSGNDVYVFKSGNADIIPPDFPMDWSKALFVDVSGMDKYSTPSTQFVRGDGKEWGTPQHSVGIDALGEDQGNWLESLPHKPRGVDIFYSPTKGWGAIGSFEELPQGELPDLQTKDYVAARRALEALDLARFTHKANTELIESIPEKLITIFQEPKNYHPAILIYALQYLALNDNDGAIDLVSIGLPKGYFNAPGVLENAIQYLGIVGGKASLPVIETYLNPEEKEAVQWRAALIIARHADKETLPLVKRALESPLESVRFATLRGLALSKPEGWQELIIPLIADPSSYVSKEAKELLQSGTNVENEE